MRSVGRGQRVGLGEGRLHEWKEGEGGGGDERDMSGNRSASGQTKMAAKEDWTWKV